MRVKRRQYRDHIGPFKINRSGLIRVTSVTLPLPFGRTLVLWERGQ
jgi:hypothetical protein